MKRNITLGVLFSVLSLFPLLGFVSLIGPKSFLVWVAIWICYRAYEILFDIGWDFLFPEEEENEE